jgi:hypothetical protein
MGLIGIGKGVTGYRIRCIAPGFVLALFSLLLLAANGAEPVNATESLADLVVVGDAAMERRSRIRLTTDEVGQVGGAWVPDPVDLHDEFEVEFSWRVTRTTPTSFADGLAFVIQTSGNTVLGDDGCWLGYNDLNSIAVEHDSWQNNPGDFGGNDYDPSHNHISVQRVDADPSNTIGFTSGVPFLANGKWHTTRIVYTPGELSVSVDNTSVLTVAIDLAEELGQDEAWVGVTAATGDLPQIHELRSFSIR